MAVRGQSGSEVLKQREDGVIRSVNYAKITPLGQSFLSKKRRESD